MKNYMKPSIQYIELRVEESLAGIGSSLNNIGRVNWIDEQIFPDIWTKFWLKVLRK